MELDNTEGPFFAAVGVIAKCIQVQGEPGSRSAYVTLPISPADVGHHDPALVVLTWGEILRELLTVLLDRLGSTFAPPNNDELELFFQGCDAAFTRVAHQQLLVLPAEQQARYLHWRTNVMALAMEHPQSRRVVVCLSLSLIECTPDGQLLSVIPDSDWHLLCKPKPTA